MTEPTLKLNVAAAVFTNVPAKQPPRSNGLRVSRRITNEDLERMIRNRTAVPILSKLSPALLAEVSLGLATGIVNAGPHVVDLRCSLEYDADDESHSVVVSTPCIPTRSYGAEVKRSDLVVMRRGEPAPVAAPPVSMWERFKGWCSEVGKPEIYNGPGGFLDL